MTRCLSQVLKGRGTSALTPVTSKGQSEDQRVEARGTTFHMNRDQDFLLIAADQ